MVPLQIGAIEANDSVVFDFIMCGSVTELQRDSLGAHQLYIQTLCLAAADSSEINRYLTS